VLSARLFGGVADDREARRDVLPDVHAQRATPTLCQDVEVAARLRRLDDAERVLPPRHRNVGPVVAGDLQEDAGVRAALVSLPRRVQEARAEAGAGCDAKLVTDRAPDLGEALLG